MPIHTPLRLQRSPERIGCQLQIAHIVEGVGNHPFGEWPPRPIGGLRPFFQLDSQQPVDQTGQAKLGETQQTRRQHCVENISRHEAASAAQQSQIVVGAVQDQFVPAKRRQQPREVQRRQRINQVVRARQADLDQAEFFGIGVETVGFGVKRDPIGSPHRRQKSGQLLIAVNHTPSKAQARRETKVDCEKSARRRRRARGSGARA